MGGFKNAVPIIIIFWGVSPFNLYNAEIYINWFFGESSSKSIKGKRKVYINGNSKTISL